MICSIDEVWASPSTLHVRVRVSEKQGLWSHKYWCAFPINLIPEEALAPLLAQAMDTDTDSSYEDLSLF